MNIIASSTLIASLLIGSLNSVEKTAKLVDQSKVTYNLEDGKQFDGAFSIEDAANNTRLRGMYKSNQRTGNWYCFNAKGEMVMRYNYDLKKLVSVDKKELDKVDIRIVGLGEKEVAEATVPLPVCSIDQYKNLLELELMEEIRNKNREASGDVKAEITAMIKEDGKAIYSANYVLDNVSYNTKVYLKDKVFTIDWIPAAHNGKAVKSEVKFSSTLKMVPSEHRRFIWSY